MGAYRLPEQSGAHQFLTSGGVWDGRAHPYLGLMTSRRRFLLSLSGLVAVPGAWRQAMAVHITSGRPGFSHPDPRPGITGEHVLAESELGGRKRVREAYEAARTHPELFDGVYCACDCSKSMGHRSLLSCFESRQPIGCMACREEGELVGRLAKEGKTLDEIRQAVDVEFAN